MGDHDGLSVDFDDLPYVDLVVDAVYRGGTHKSVRDDPLARLLPVGNQGGFRYKGSIENKTVRLVVLYTTGESPDWPDELDIYTGQFTYYGDNRTPAAGLESTPRGGNRLLSSAFAGAHVGPERRQEIPPFLLFEKAGRGRDVRFRGLLAPGAESFLPDEELVAIWRSSGGSRFQNYRAHFTVLDVPVVSRAWIDELLSGITTGPAAPQAWRDWVTARRYAALQAPPTTAIRSRTEQTPDPAGQELIAEILAYFGSAPTEFERCAVELWRMMAPATGSCEVTRASRDGGRDAVGEYLLGPLADQVAVEFALEAKCYAPDNSVGVRETARLISRLRNRQFGVFVTTSFFNHQAYQEVRSDGHPVVMVCGRDIADLLRSRGYSTREDVRAWLRASFP